MTALKSRSERSGRWGELEPACWECRGGEGTSHRQVNVGMGRLGLEGAGCEGFF